MRSAAVGVRSVADALARGGRWARRERVLGPALILPAFLYVALLVGLPFLYALYLSMSDATTGNPYGSFIGLRNFVEVVETPVFQNAVRNTFVFTISAQLATVVLANVLARALNASFRGKGLVLFLILLPWVAPVSLATIGWLWILHARFSVIDWVLWQLSLLPHDTNMFWLGKPNLAMLSVVTVHVWRLLPFATVVLLAGLTSLPRDLLDQAEVDGAGFWRRLFQVELPLLLPITSVVVLFGTIFTFTDMAVVYVLTRGGPFDTTQVLSSLAFFKGIVGGNLSVGAAISLFLFPVLFIVAILVLRIARSAEVT
ncbi:MAG: sugar ABC transporter permease [Armatimonadota bacterium]|nr:sugar ABC transporter permease [Armatimonadota bacterium]MDR5697604.1 sugar ABC transporter permease [Armatimonadota bacterium]